MSNILDIKGVKLFAVVLVALAILATFGMVAVQKASADCSITTTLRMGSKGDQVACLQTALGGLTVDGNFGAKTKAAVMVFQSHEGLTADGVFGPKSNAAWVANQLTGNFPAGCNSAVGFSNTTGLACYNVPGPFPVGCSSSAGFSSVTGASCAFPSSSLPAGCTSTAGFSPSTGVMCNTSPSLSFPAGCTSSAGFSPTTGASCSGSPSPLPAGCSSASGFSPTTGQSCGSPVSNTTNGEGELTSISKLGSFNNVKVAEGQVDVAVLGIQATAKDGIQNVDTIRVAFKNIGGGASSVKLSKYVQDISIWLDGKEIGRKSVTAFSDDAGDTYTYRFTGMTGVIPVGHQAQILVAVTGAGSMDSADASAEHWSVGAGTVATGDVDFLTASSSNGRFNDFGPGGITSTIDFQKAGGVSSDQRYRVSTATNNPIAQTIQVSRTSDTTGVLLLAFDVKAENGAMKIQRIPVHVTTVAGALGAPLPNVDALVKSVQLYANGVKIADEAVPAATTCTGVDTPHVGCTGAGTGNITSAVVTFGNTSKLQYPVAMDATVHMEVRVDLNDTEDTAVVATDFDEGDQVRADYTALDVTNSTIELDNANQDNVANRTGSASGELQTARSTGMLATMNTSTTESTSSTTGLVISRTFTIPVTIRAFDDDMFIGKTVLNGTTLSAANPLTANSAQAISYTIEDSTGATYPVGVAINSMGSASATWTSTDAPQATVTCTGAGAPVASCTGAGTIETFQVSSGSTRHFVLSVVLSDLAAGTANRLYRIQMNNIQGFTTSSVLTANAVQQILAPSNAFETPYATIATDGTI